MLTFVPDVPFCCCPPWRLRCLLLDEDVHGARCFKCDREVAAPAAAKGKRVACIYCGLDEGWIPEIDSPICDTPAWLPPLRAGEG